MKALTQENLQEILQSDRPQNLSFRESPPIPDDHVAHLLALIQRGQTALAADHLLFPEINGRLSETVGGLIQKLNLLFYQSKLSPRETQKTLKQKVHFRQHAYEVLLEMALNFFGLESRWLDEREKTESVGFILNTLGAWEDLEREEGSVSVAKAVIHQWLLKMKRVQRGGSMVAKTASRMEEKIDWNGPLFRQLLTLAQREIQQNPYYQMVNNGLCRFGNDYALGLRWLRHLGFEQVSTNPVLAARAYQDEPGLTDLLLAEVRGCPEGRRWLSQPRRYGEDIALYATLLCLWENLYVFRPLFFNLRETSGGGVVSFQLNPNVAHQVEESLRDVFKAFSLASERLALYDQYLLAGYRIDGWKGRPNLVIKVAATTGAARAITRMINAFGFGSNITVDFSVSQEATLLLEEMEGMAEALKKGIQPTQVYVTNMGGRLESHLREIKLEELFRDLKEAVGEEEALRRVLKLSEANGTKEKVAQGRTYEEKVIAATRYANGQRTIDDPIYEALAPIATKETLRSLEEAIATAGTLVARRVWFIFFSEQNRERWIAYLSKKKGLTQNQARQIMDRIYYLPASKRKPFDTLWTLSSRNLVHTEFPDHQENVRRMAEDPHVDLMEYRESIADNMPAGILDELSRIEDFRKAFELNRELAKVFEEAGLCGDFGLGGLDPSEWPTFGPVVKTLFEFKKAYDTFKEEVSCLVKGAGREGGRCKRKGKR
ncbi:MAG: hypothetical protein N3G78_01040 [Desulfobacterota bacterium]|nr:hypothetical protein [Thermodesulfobacteriota bacterium]